MKKFIIAITLISLLIFLRIHHINEIATQQINNDKIIKQEEIKKEIPKPIQQPKIALIQPEQLITNREDYILMRSSAYTCSKEEGTQDRISYSGVEVSRGSVAVDPKRIPLGTKLYIEGYGHATAHDVGGAIKGDRIDLYMETKKEAFTWGRKNVRVWIIKERKTR